MKKVTNHQQIEAMELRANKPKEVTRTPEYPQLIPPDPNNVYYNFPQASEFYPYMYPC